jgi:PcRGLX-like protein central beta sandwich domain
MRTTTSILFLSLFALLLSAASAISGEQLKLKLTVTEPAGAVRKAEPACGGIPLPWGKFKADQQFTVSSGGRAIPAQVLPLVVDEKGYLRWVLVDTQLDLAARAKAELLLTTGKSSAQPPRPLKVEVGGDGVTVDTGKARFTISKSKPFSLFTSVSVGRKTAVEGGSASYTDATLPGEPQSFAADKPTSITVTDAGLMRATVKVIGRFKGDAQTKMRYVARYTFWAGSSRVSVKYSLSNSNPDHYCFRMIRESRLALKLAGAGAAGGSGALITVPTSAGKIYAHDLYLEANPPRKLEVKGGELLLRGITPREEAERVPWKTKNLWLFDSTHYSSHYVLDFAPGAADLAARKGADRATLHIMAPSAWYAETAGLAVGKFGTQADELKCYDTWKWKYDAKRVPKRPGNHFKRLRRYVRGADNHYDTEEDVLESFVLMYLRTGSRAYFDQGLGWANYNMDLQTFRTDGWKYRDGAVWWTTRGSPLGNRPQRKVDPVTGLRNRLIKKGSDGAKGKHKVKRVPVNLKIELGGDGVNEIQQLSISKQCYCHCYASGLAGWFCITGDRDALEAAIDSVEQNYDSQKRGKNKVVGKSNVYSRDFTRSSYLAAGVRLAAPTNKLVVEASDFLNQVYVKRPAPELRGLVRPSSSVDMGTIKKLTAGKGPAKMTEMGVKLEGGFLVDKDGNKWQPVINPHTWMYTYQAGALECYYRATGDEDAMDHCIAYGQAVAHVLWQPKHGNLAYGSFIVDVPVRGYAEDHASWQLPAGSKLGKGVKINGYLAGFHPDIPARAYSLTGEKFLKQRAYDYWWGASHRGYNRTNMHALGGVGAWVNINGVHAEHVNMTGRTFYEWSHPRSDTQAPKAVADLAVKIEGDKATISFTAPADAGGGKVTRYQVKCSDRKIAEYEQFLKLFNAHGEKAHCNWFLASNVKGEPSPKAAGGKESFTVTGVPKGAKYFAVRVFDDSSNRSAISNAAEAK